MGRVKDKKILKLDLKYSWIKFSSLITARLSDVGGMFVQGGNVCEPAREMLWIRRKSCLYSGVVSFSQYKLIWRDPSPQYEAGTISNTNPTVVSFTEQYSLSEKSKSGLFYILYDEKYINCTFKLNHAPPKLLCIKTDNFSGENSDVSANIHFLLKNVRKTK